MHAELFSGLGFCSVHPLQRSVGQCAYCGRPVCESCARHHIGTEELCSWLCLIRLASERLGRGVGLQRGGVTLPRFACLVIMIGFLATAGPAVARLVSLNRAETTASFLEVPGFVAPETLPDMEPLAVAPVTFDPPAFSKPEGDDVQSEASLMSSTEISAPVPIQTLAETGEFPEWFQALDNVEVGCGDQKSLALTFDGGWMDNAAPFILDSLQRARLHATFFLTGIFVKKYPDQVRRILSEGHEIGNHTNTHRHLTSVASSGTQKTLSDVNRDVVISELVTCAEAFKQTTGIDMAPIWRAPYGEHNQEIRAWAKEAGFMHVSWTSSRGRAAGGGLDSLDWVSDEDSPSYRSSQETVASLLSGMRNGGIVLMHLGSLRKEDPVHLRLPELILNLQGQGYEFVTVTHMAHQVATRLDQEGPRSG